MRNSLLAPVVGVSVVVLLATGLSQLGQPVKNFAVPLTLALAAVSVGLLWRLRPRFPVRRYLPFAAVLLLGLLAVGRPLVEFGYHWLGYANDDMANYVLGAQRFLEHGFYDLPDEQTFLAEKDATLAYWYLHAHGGYRAGPELLLAWAASATGLNGLQIYMPLTLALHLGLISAAGGLVCFGPGARRTALLTCLVLGSSALHSLGFLYQLLPQVLGLALLAGCAAVLLHPVGGPGWSVIVRRGLLVFLLAGPLLTVYPEAFPFILPAAAGYLVVALVRKRSGLRRALAAIGCAGLVLLIVFNRYLLVILEFVRYQSGRGASSGDLAVTQFPYFLVPQGLASLWGLLPVSQRVPEPWVSLAILAGFLALLAAAAAAAWLAWLGKPVAFVALVMLGAGLYLFLQRAPFGTFKLAMFLQPFLLGTLVTAWLRLCRGRIRWHSRRSFPRTAFLLAPVVVFCLANWRALNYHVERSRGEVGAKTATFSQIPNASSGRLQEALSRLAAGAKAPVVLSDAANVVLAKLEMFHFRGRTLLFPCYNFLSNIAAADERELVFDRWYPAMAQRVRWLAARRTGFFVRAGFDFSGGHNALASSDFLVYTGGGASGAPSSEISLIRTGPQHSVLNRRHIPPSEKRSLTIQPLSDVRNHLIFVVSHRGGLAGSTDPRHVSLFQLEPDLFYPGSTMAGVGRYLLFEVLRPSEKGRLVLSMTATLKGDGRNELPPAALIGSERLPLPQMGRGSARLISEPLSPRRIGAHWYLGVDMGVDGVPFPDERSGLAGLYGRDVPSDPRRLVGFAREISFVSEQDYAHARPPSELSEFPGGLANRDLEYGGIYEDGWVAESSMVRLTQLPGHSRLVLRGLVPRIGNAAFRCEGRLLVDGAEVTRRILEPGEFAWQAELAVRPGPRRIHLHFTRTQRLPAPDNRVVVGRIRSLGFQATAGGASPR